MEKGGEGAALPSILFIKMYRFPIMPCFAFPGGEYSRKHVGFTMKYRNRGVYTVTHQYLRAGGFRTTKDSPSEQNQQFSQHHLL